MMEVDQAEHAASLDIVRVGERTKRPFMDADDSPDAAGGGLRVGFQKQSRTIIEETVAPVLASTVNEPLSGAQEDSRENSKIYPFFGYKDFSTTPDEDSLTMLTPPGRVPNFLAKMHSILSRPELTDIVAWLPHGRAWHILKPREFEIKVLPTYFEHSKLSSFLRQANGWGFRRVSRKGRDHNAYYHDLFLRALPHLCKKMKRLPAFKKQRVHPDHEPDFYKISEMHPVPKKFKDDSILLTHTIDGGPKARQPICFRKVSSFSSKKSLTIPPLHPTSGSIPAVAGPGSFPTIGRSQLTPTDHKNLAEFQKLLGTSESHLSIPSIAPPSPSGFVQTPKEVSGVLATANQLAFAGIQCPATQMDLSVAAAAAFQASTAASQFAAGFAAAAALSQQQTQAMLGSLMAASNVNNNVVMAQVASTATDTSPPK